MKTFLRCALATALAASVSAPAAAGELRLTMSDGRVTLIAHDVTVREILAEWARVGQAKIVNGDKVTGGPISIELTDVPEARALDTVLRSAAGYVMAPRTAGSPGASMYDRILILATSRAPMMPPSSNAPFANRPMPQNQPNPTLDDDGDFNPPPVTNPLGQPAGMMPQAQPGMPLAQPAGPLTAPRPGMLPPPAAAQPTMNPYLGTPPGQTSPTFNPNPAPVPTTPRGPGGGGAGSR
ncbi:MAG: hypothetical protein ABIX28_15380 [Vicinamibacterales bacterium]